MPDLADLRTRIGTLTLRDEARLGRRLEGVRGQRRADVRAQSLAELEEQVRRAEALVQARAAAVPTVRYPDLPVSQRRGDIAQAIATNQVVVVAGETGSGKTTQLPKICLELGRGIRGTIGHTQPRRLAARTVAQRIADELETPLGDAVGYSVRFTDRVGDRTLVKLMTDGILLAEIQRDRRLLAYDTLILDEAHERSLNIDFLIGYLTQLLPRRPDLKLIVTSATIDPQRFADHFGGAPVVEVSGRTYPVEIRYRPLEPDAPTDSEEDDDADDPDHEIVHRVEARDQIDGVLDAVRELTAEGPGDILVFLSGEREIRDTADALTAMDLRNTEVLPLYARLATADQQRVFQPHPGMRRIVLATNVAETSLTVPGVHYVIDPGTARISRYSRRTKVQRLPIESISQASAGQRSGRCGRTASGICIRLYSERDYEARPRFTEPEILRTNLASVLLQMAALGLGEIATFPFLDPPERRSVRDGIGLLQELGAFDRDAHITEVGRRLARIPVDPRIGRMILQAEEEGCVREVLVLAAALSIPDPRERPTDQLAAAQQKHARFQDETSDFLTFLNLWRYLREKRRDLSGSQFRKLCHSEFLHYLRAREWQDLRGQLRTITRDLGIAENDEPAGAESVHAAVTAGLLSHVGMRTVEGRDYQGARNTRFLLAPGSVLARRPTRWVVVAELVETSRLYGRVAARADPETIERIAGDLVERSYSEPHWDAERGAAMAFERVTLYGLPLAARRRVGYAKVAPDEAREIFLRSALVEGQWRSRHRFLRDNQNLLQEVAELEERARRRDLVIGDDELFAFYDARVPASVVSARHFDAWWKKERHKHPELLNLARADVLRKQEPDQDHPETWRTGDLTLPVTYRFEPSAEDDGVTVHVPVDVLARLGGQDFSWQVPALREELLTALVRSLPKDLRRAFVPVPDTVRAVLDELDPGQEPLLDGVQRILHRRTGVLVPLDAFDWSKVPRHLRVTFAVEDGAGRVVARGKDLSALQARLAAPARAAVANAVAGDLERTGLTSWPADLEQLPRFVERSSGAHLVRGFPAFVDEKVAVDLKVFATALEQAAAMPAGCRRLIRLTLPSPSRAVERSLGARSRLVLAGNPDGSVAALIDDCADAAVDALVAALPATDRVPWSKPGFEDVAARIRPDLPVATSQIVAEVERVLTAAHDVRRALPERPPPAHAESIEDIRRQLQRLLPPGFVTATGRSRLADLVRYLTAIGRRLETLPRDPDTDRARMARVRTVQQAYDDLRRALPRVRADAPDLEDIRWQIEELRVSLWAQQLGTPRPVSERRIFRAIDAVVA